MLYETFHTAGGKGIRLTVTDRKGRASSTVKTVSVSAAAPPLVPRCSNGQDDDGDGKIDYPNDPGCDSANDDTESPDPAPSSVQYVSPTAGTTVNGVAPVRVRVPSGTNWIGVYACGGRSVGEDLAPEADGTFTVQWDTTICANGQANLDTWAFRNDGSNLGHTEIFVSVNNTAQSPLHRRRRRSATRRPYPRRSWGWGSPSGSATVSTRSTGRLGARTSGGRRARRSGSQTVANGELRLRSERSTGYADTTMTTEPCGQPNPRSFQYGYFEARMRYETVQGNGPAFWLFSTRHATNHDWPPSTLRAQKGLPTIQCVSAELDVFEGFGKILYGGSRTDDFFSRHAAPQLVRLLRGGEPVPVRPARRRCRHEPVAHLRRPMDADSDHLLHRRVAQGAVAPFDSTAQPMHLLLYNWNTGWEDENMPTSASENELDVFVDWVRVWQQ